MSASELNAKTAVELAKLLADGEISSVDLTTACLNRIEAVDGSVKAFLSVDREDALAQARASDERRAQGKSLGPLDGIPLALKDIVAVTGQPLTCASKMLENFVSPYDATSVEKLKAAGAVLFGRLNMDEFAMGSSTENSAFGRTHNPWDLDRVPGGSSGGSAASVAAAETILSLGSDTGGSIRQPAAFCGTVGLKPTYGRISRFGLVAFASSLDQIGPFTRCVEDAALFLDAVCGHDPKDSTSLPDQKTDFLAGMASLKDRKWKIGVPKEFLAEGLDPEVRASVESAIEFYEGQGCTVEEVSLPHSSYAVPVYYILATAEASSNLARYDGIRYGHRSEEAKDGIELYYKSRGEGFGEEVKRRIMLGTYVLSSGYYDAYYLRAQKVRSLIRKDFDDAFAKVDCLIGPATPTVAFRAGDKVDDPLSMYLSDVYTISANLAGLPAMSVPCGLSSEGCPIGMQIISPVLQEAEMLAVAKKFEDAHEFSGIVAPDSAKGGASS
ncbi:Asp-tRNA(Asn)/Glu-tRNA(Gln) amidotransferase subunit GatA [Puniceicoccus vermicola]|uniref:Glutamyl-tRNA(Gln) amidotransferase subunit A n=1 Tax=Puniceicoccus vermicola TaxID=388746 RepID=A0A7X1E4D5_9BACT|nr:Asp-tRNA(Asn)/Glu-tRNA(Gln) amidotransferase subunit GatA [Puniceicoccus vermicola]MBC2601878.1 Asp-tRNA(Asn)/Glu-tRNA(Gln) amidotransferase subunit GatA [Puniceicoccus vermicola]